MDNLPPSTYSQRAAQYSAALESSFTDPSFAENGISSEGAPTGDGNYVPRPKRIACVVCRRRKLRCDGRRPSCGTCSRLGHECAYDEVRKKSGPKRGYVKQLEARLAQVETLLKGQDAEPAPRTSPPQPMDNPFSAPLQDDSILSLPDLSGLENELGNAMPATGDEMGASQPSQMMYPSAGSSFPADTQWDLVSLGLEEPLPPPDVVEELDALFFEKVYPMMPIVHRFRYYNSLLLSPQMRPPVCLRYMMWCHAASISDKYFFLHNHFYQRARKYAELDEMKGFGETIISLAHCQTWILIGTYEFRMIYFPRAWLSVGKAARLALMMGLNRLDGAGLDVKQSMLPPKDWTEREERRRVFWFAFCTDRYASIGTGWPLAIDEGDVMTNLPASEESFLKSKPQRTLRLSDIIAGEGVSTLAPFACVVVLASLFGRNLIHIHRPQPQDNDHDLNGEFWKRHRSHDNVLLHIALSLPDHLRLPSGMDDVNVIFANMSIHTSTICLHQAAIFKAEKNKMPNQIITESKRRCLVAANQISSIMKMVSHMDLTLLNPFMTFCLYIAARVFVQYLKSRPDDSTVYSSLQFVISALNAMKGKNPLTESFLVQLDVDLEGTGIRAIENLKSGTSYAAQAMQAYCTDKVDCNSIYTVRDAQSSEVPRGPQDLANPPGSTRPSMTGGTTSLPSRRRDLSDADPERADSGNNSQAFFPHMSRLPDGTVQSGIVDVDMDFSPDFGLGERNPPSDHPTPSTLNSSSNTSYSISGADNPSPGKKHQKTTTSSATSFDQVNSIHTSSSTTESPQIPNMSATSGQAYPNNTGSMGSTAAANAFAMTSQWDMSTPNTALNNVEFGNVNVDSLSDAQWAHILNNSGNGPDWADWRPS
ncbi:Exosome complex exonuclease dis3 [Penicillium atrosanguineum]|uniref:Zn(2)-C6 fungal-type domain-containing protein n=1 Tax=Penicillium atrosanguineum TaxID=1132637 RepID=A0A9W9Q4L1_9EURO|nr:Exosome complex exonuclease dis3 [Penicillium atrosanguineum]KAJ5305042.1 Exosome complex exonuclease dis3 [Penicillium atrosanguineum]KAJ5324508.1 hypothetical protein N7476_003108 [Penicillium atrosanguineum]